MANPIDVSLIKVEPWTVTFALQANVQVEPIRNARGVFCIKVINGSATIEGTDVTAPHGVIVGCGLGPTGVGNIGMKSNGGATISITLADKLP